MSEMADISREVGEIRKAQIGLVAEFYKLPSEVDNVVNNINHLAVAQQIGAQMDSMLVHLLDKEEDKVVDLLPLRGGVSIVPVDDGYDTNILGSNEIDQRFIALGAKRNGDEAHVYFPGDEEIKALLNLIEDDEIVRIKDFGIATGGTAEALAQLLIKNGVEAKRIIVQGVVGTKMAYDRLSKIEGLRVDFAVEGRMPIELKADSVTGDSYYVTEIRGITDGPFSEINPNEFIQVREAKDWGDACLGTMLDQEYGSEIQIFLERLQRVMLLKDEGIDTEQISRLMEYYIGLKEGEET